MVSLLANLFPAPDGTVNSFEDMRTELNRWIAANSYLINKTGFISGFGYDDANLVEKTHPDRFFLDSINSDIPIFIIHESSHLGVLNSKGL